MLRRSSERTRAGVATVGVAALALVVVEILKEAVGGFDPRPEINALIILTSGALGLVVDRIRTIHALRAARSDRDSMLDDDLAMWPLPPLATADPHLLGVFPVDVEARARVGPYVPRDVDGELEDALRDHPLVVVFGPARSGKSRTALEVARRVLPDARVIVPEGADELRRLMGISPPLDCRPYPAVIWLDGLDRFVSALDLDLLDALGGARDLRIVATIREEEYGAMVEAGGELGETGKRLLTRARGVRVPADLSERELEEAKALLPDYPGQGPLGVDIAKAWRDGHAPIAPPRGKSTLGIVVVSRERDTKPGLDVSERRFELDPRLAAGTLLLLALAVLTTVRIIDGGFAEKEVSLGERLATAEADHPPRWGVTRRPLALRGADQMSHLIVYTPPDSQRSLSSEVRVYDQNGERLTLRFRFQPEAEPREGGGRPVGWRFFVRNARVDVDRRGGVDVAGAFRPAGRLRGAVVPVLLYRKDDGRKGTYTLKALGKEKLGGRARPGLDTDGVPLRDIGGTTERVGGYVVADFTVVRLHEQVKFIVGTALDAPESAEDDRVKVRAWRLADSKDQPYLGSPCATPTPPVVEVPRSGELWPRLVAAWRKVDDEVGCDAGPQAGAAPGATQ